MVRWSLLISRSQGRMLASSSNLRKPAKEIKHIAAKCKLDKEFVSLASLTTAWSISTVKGAFLQTGLARALLSPSNVAWMNGEVVGEGIPAIECAHAKLLTASSTADLEALVSPKC